MSTVLLLAAMPMLSIAGIDADIAQDHQVILNGAWTPTIEQTAKALKGIQEFLEDPKGQSEWNRKQIERILKHTSAYRVQFVGVEENGQKLVRCNFLPASPEEGRDRFPKWKAEMVFVLDGGFWFWRVDYDIESGECINFSSNGGA